MSKGICLFAQKNEKSDYYKQAVACAMSIKATQEISNVSIVTDDNIPDKYKGLFDHVFNVPWRDDKDLLISTNNVVAGVITLEPPGALSFSPSTFSPVNVSVVRESARDTKLASGSLEFNVKLPSDAVLVEGSPILKIPSLL